MLFCFILVSFCLKEQPAFDKKQFVTYMKRYIKLLTLKLEPEAQEAFKTHIEGATRFLLSKLKDLQLYVLKIHLILFFPLYLKAFLWLFHTNIDPLSGSSVLAVLWGRACMMMEVWCLHTIKKEPLIQLFFTSLMA